MDKTNPQTRFSRISTLKPCCDGIFNHCPASLFSLNPRFLLRKISQRKDIPKYPRVQRKRINSQFAPCCDSQCPCVRGNHLQHHLGASQGLMLMDLQEKSIFGLVFSSLWAPESLLSSGGVELALISSEIPAALEAAEK